jgi:hypothetical protein
VFDIVIRGSVRAAATLRAQTPQAREKVGGGGPVNLVSLGRAMVQLVSSALIEETWRAIGASSSATIRKLQKQCGKEQEQLTGFLLAFTSDLRPEALGFALYIHLVVAQAFRQCGGKFRRIRSGRIERTWQANFAFIDHLKTRGYTRTPFRLEPGLTTEPAIMEYVVDALTEEDGEPIDLSIEEFWHILHVLKTVSDCLHDASFASERAP